MPEVSVIVPLYNKGKYIARALDSVFAQTYQDFELIVVDDGSADDGPDIVRKYDDARMLLVRQTNSGPGAARNKGIKESTAPYVAFLDADDEWLPDFLGSYLEKIGIYHSCDVVIGPSFFGFQKKDRSVSWRKMGIEEGSWRLHDSSTWKDLELINGLFHPCSALFKRKVIERYYGFYDKNKCRYSEDRYLWLQIVLNHKIHIIMKPAFWYHSENSDLYPPDAYGQPGYVSPVLLDPAKIYNNCPPEYLGILQRYLCYLALTTISTNYLNMNLGQLNNLMARFPGRRYFFWKYLKAKLKISTIRKLNIWKMRRKYIPESIKERYRLVRAGLLSMGLNGKGRFSQSEEELLASNDISLIIPVSDAPKVTSRCLGSVERYCGSAEVILVDDASHLEETRDIIHSVRERNGWRLISHQKRLGHSRACNHGAEFATRKYLCFLNSDTVITPWSWLAAKEAFESDPGIAVTGPSTSRTSTKQQIHRATYCRMYWSDREIWAFARRYVSRQAARSWVDLPYVGGFAFFIRRQIWNQFKGFDTNIPDYGNELELCKRLAGEGYRIVWTANSYIHHFGKSSYDNLDASMRP